MDHPIRGLAAKIGGEAFCVSEIAALHYRITPDGTEPLPETAETRLARRIAPLLQEAAAKLRECADTIDGLSAEKTAHRIAVLEEAAQVCDRQSPSEWWAAELNIAIGETTRNRIADAIRALKGEG